MRLHESNFSYNAVNARNSDDNCELSRIRIQYSIFGNPDNLPENGHLIFHGLSSNTRPDKWWKGFFENLDFEKNSYLAVNVPGSCFGSSGPDLAEIDATSKTISNFPYLSISDQVDFVVPLLDHWKINQLQKVIGFSLGGMHALDMYFRHPRRMKKCISGGAVTLPLTIKMFNEFQFRLIEREINANNPRGACQAMSDARFLLRLLCSNNEGLVEISNEARDTRDQCIERSLLDHLETDAENYKTKFHPTSYVNLMRAVNNFDISADSIPDRNLDHNKVCLTLIGFKNDKFTPPDHIKGLNDRIAKLNGQSRYLEFDTKFGHESWILDSKNLWRMLKNEINC